MRVVFAGWVALISGVVKIDFEKTQFFFHFGRVALEKESSIKIIYNISLYTLLT